jgi:hypothetical protein
MDEVDRATSGYDDQAEEHLQVQAEIQDVLDGLHGELAGAPVEDVVVAINVGLARAGIPEQPHRWVQVMAERISAGLPPVADTRAAVDAVRLADAEPATFPPEPVEPESVEPGATVEGAATPPPSAR